MLGPDEQLHAHWYVHKAVQENMKVWFNWVPKARSLCFGLQYHALKALQRMYNTLNIFSTMS